MKKTCLVLVWLFLNVHFLSSATAWHIDPQGNDSNVGSKVSPFLTIQLGIDKSEPGDTILIYSGNYVLEKPLTFGKSGKSNKYIYLIGENKVVIDAQAITKNEKGGSFSFGTNGALQIEKSSYISIQNIKIINSHSAGIIVRGPSKCVTLDHCTVENTFNSGMAVWYADSVKIYNCEVSKANRQEMRVNYPLRSEAPHEAISMCGATHFEVAFNDVHHCDKEGIDCKEVSAFGTIHHNYVHDMPRQGLYVDSWFGTLHDVAFYSNTVTRCEWGMAISGEGKNSFMENIEIHHNLFYKNKGSGLLFGVWGDNRLRKNIAIYNNTIIENGSENHWAGMVGGIDMKSSNLMKINIYNNIVANNYHFQIALPAKPAKQDAFLKTIECSIENNLAYPFKITPNVQKSYFNDVFSTKGKKTIENDPTLDSNFKPLENSAAYISDGNSDLGAFERTKKSLFPPIINP